MRVEHRQEVVTRAAVPVQPATQLTVPVEPGEHLLVVPTRPPDHHQMGVRVVEQHALERVEQGGVVLARLDGADGEHVALPHQLVGQRSARTRVPRGVRAQGDDPRLGRAEARRRCPLGERPGRVRRDGEHRVGVPGLCGHRAVRDPHQARLEPLGVLLGQQVVHQHRDVHTGAAQRPVELVTVDPGVVPDRVQVEQHRSRGRLDPERHQRAVPCAPQDPATGTSQLRLDPGRDQHGHQRPAHPAEQRPTAGQGDAHPAGPGPGVHRGGGRRCAGRPRREPQHLVVGQRTEATDRFEPDHRHDAQPGILAQPCDELGHHTLDPRTPVGRHRVGDVDVHHQWRRWWSYLGIRWHHPMV